MGVAYCPECGKLYMENPCRMCAACYRQEEEDEIKVSEFLREKSKASLEEIHQATGVKHKVILRMIKSGRITGDYLVEYPCETCSTLISEGRLCSKCNKGLQDQLKPPNDAWKSAERQASQKSKSHMYINDIIRR